MGNGLFAHTENTRPGGTFKAGFWRVWPVSGRTAKLLEGDKGFSFFHHQYQELLTDGSRILFVWESVDRPAELYESDADFKDLKRLTDFGSMMDGVDMGRSQSFRGGTSRAKS